MIRLKIVGGSLVKAACLRVKETLMTCSLYVYVNWTGKSGPFQTDVQKEAFKQHKRVSNAVIGRYAFCLHVSN